VVPERWVDNTETDAAKAEVDSSNATAPDNKLARENFIQPSFQMAFFSHRPENWEVQKSGTENQKNAHTTKRV
jgi:hypothetical protein